MSSLHPCGKMFLVIIPTIMSDKVRVISGKEGRGRELGMNRLQQTKRKIEWESETTVEAEREEKKKRTVYHGKRILPGLDPRCESGRKVSPKGDTRKEPERMMHGMSVEVRDSLRRIEHQLDSRKMESERDQRNEKRLHEMMRDSIEQLLPGKEAWTPDRNRLVSKRTRLGIRAWTDDQILNYASSVHTIAREASMSNYLSSLRAWLTFSHECGYDWQQPTAMMMLGFAVYRHSGGLSTSSMWKEFGKIKSLLGDMGITMIALKHAPIVVNVIKGMEIIAELDGGKEKRYPCTTVHLRDCLGALKDVEGVSEDEKVMFGAMWPVMLFALLRIGEVLKKRKGAGWSSPLTWKDVKFHTCPRTQKEYAILSLPPSKTDKTGKKFKIVLERLESQHSEICPVRALHRLKSCLPGECLDWEVFEHRTQGLKITYERFTNVLKLCLNQSGYDDSKYHSHSWRIGGATVARAMGFTSDEIKALGRWMSDAYLVYTRPCLEHQGKLAARLQDWDLKLSFA